MLLLLTFTATIFTSATLLFLIQPMFARMVLPSLGGSPAVWNTALVFYQGVLLAGYGYAHLLTTRLKSRAQILVHLAVLLLPLAFLPFAIPANWAPPSDHNPTGYLLRLMMLVVGIPFFAVSASSPILQKWFATTAHRSACDPYFLYGASNAGSMLALLAYPALVERWLRLAEQSRFWQGIYFVLIALFALCGVWIWRSLPSPRPSPVRREREKTPGVTFFRRLRWIVLAFIPSSLMQGVTSHLSTELAPVPLLWVIPLAIYLLTFILVFAPKPLISSQVIIRFLPVSLVPLIMAIATGVTQPLILLICLHLVFLFFASMACHGWLAEDRPSTEHLTEFYFWMSFGGVLGGVFNALLAPVLFATVVEYPIGIVLASLFGLRWNWRKCRLREFVINALFAITIAAMAAVLAIVSWSSGWATDSKAQGIVFGIPALICFFLSKNPLRFAMCVAAFLWAGRFASSERGKFVYAERSFFGVSRVTESPSGNYYRLFHGNTLHGLQSRDPNRKREALTYYYRTGPIGQVFGNLPQAHAMPVAAVGLGAGSIATYGQAGQEFTFYEIDPVVNKIASDPRFFSFLHDSPAKIKVVLGDARLKLVSAPDHHYGLMVLDAYSSDAVPVHLITREAIQLYLKKLAPGGVLAFHISNRHLDLQTVLAPLARDARLICVVQDQSETTPAETAQGKTVSTWALMARGPNDLATITKSDTWKPVAGSPNARVWTDDYSSLLSVVEW